MLGRHVPSALEKGHQSKGYVVVFFQENIVPPTNCSWILDVLKAFGSWPQLVAFRLGRGESNDRVRLSDSKDVLRRRDQPSCVRFQFSDMLHFTPAAVKGKEFLDTSRFDESFRGAECQL